ncbi:uncharacterized protein BDV14DRAFT_34656 [Aspergillus stella-maris]|uniref:uncharacterized protein n=1 Tax=Aspergillus stella-maris TaxID=1810926 RepID=UPI003CCE18A1
MDTILSKKTALKRRASLTLLFGSQKPTFAASALDERPTRYYEFVDTPLPPNPKVQSPFIDRQEIAPELESKVRHACSLLVYRIEQGVPSQGKRRATRNGSVGHESSPIPVLAKPQLNSRLPSSKTITGAEGNFITGYDSGVGLTQQPSMQTMRILHSRSGDAYDSAKTMSRAHSVFSNARTGTSCSNTSGINSTDLSCTQSSEHSPPQLELHSLTGVALTAFQPEFDMATKAFLSESRLEAEPSPLASREKEKQSQRKGEEDQETETEVQVFLSPHYPTINLNLSTETLSSTPSPSLSLSRVPALNQNQNKHTPAFTSDPNSGLQDNSKTRNIIIDVNGQARLLTPDEASQRNKALQQAVLAKMTQSFGKRTGVRKPSQGQNKPQSTTHHAESRVQPEIQPPAPAPPPSRLGLAWAEIKSDFEALKHKDQERTPNFHYHNHKAREGKSRLGRLSKLLARGRFEHN